jgi:large subunit ribosomal protein L3
MSEAVTTQKPAAPVTLKALLGQKVGMTQIFDPHGQSIPVTVVQAGPCQITQVMTKERHGYEAVQMAFGAIREKSLNKPDAGRFKKVNLAPAKWVREFRTDQPSAFQVGQTLTVGAFTVGDYVDVTGISKGRGFTGVVKRHHFSGGPSTHGQSDRQRAPGSIGSNTFPGHTFRGQRMAGHMGVQRATSQHVEIVQVLPDKNLLLIRGAVPGANRNLVVIRETVKPVKVRKQPVVVVSKKEKAPKKEAAKPAPAPAAAAKPKVAKQP